VRIGSIIPLAASFVAAVINRLSRRYPRIMFDVIATQTEALHQQLHDRNVDLLIARRFGPLADERLEFEFLFDDSFVVVAGARSPWIRRRGIKLSQLVNEPWALPPPESATGSVPMEAFHASGLDYPRATVFTVPAEVRMGLVATGRFLTISAASLLKFSRRRPELKVLPVELPIAPVPNGIVTLKNRTISPVARLFVEHAREVSKSLAKRK
jgi:DNA-binding transcriptional LysR family regulator